MQYIHTVEVIACSDSNLPNTENPPPLALCPRLPPSRGRCKSLSAQDLIHFDSRLAYLVLHRPDLLLEVRIYTISTLERGGVEAREWEGKLGEGAALAVQLECLDLLWRLHPWCSFH